MHQTLIELLENQRGGLLWVSQDATVRYANAAARQLTALSAGSRVYDPDLTRAISQTVTAGVSSSTATIGVAAIPGAALPELECRVIPGLSRDDAFVLLRHPQASDPADAFGNLMLVIRSDLHDPLTQVQADLMHARDGDPHHVDALVDRIGELTQVTGKLLDLATVWSSGAVLANDRIELWPLLQRVWGELEPLAMNLNVKVRFRTATGTQQLAALYGSEPWLRRVFLECLEAALRAARPGSTLDIVHRQMGPRAMIIFHDTGVFAQRDHAAIVLGGTDQPAGAARSRTAARDHISLKLCRHIVSLHGGELREEEEDGLRNFLVDLPTGAPHRQDHSQLDIAQAQRYAADLATLMARARGQRHP